MNKPQKKPQLLAMTKNRKDEVHHFFVSSVATWKVGYDVASLIDTLKREGYPFNVFMVPGPVESDYRIESYAPQAEGTVWVGFYGFKEV